MFIWPKEVVFCASENFPVFPKKSEVQTTYEWYLSFQGIDKKEYV